MSFFFAIHAQLAMVSQVMTLGQEIVWYVRLLGSTLPWFGALQLFAFSAWPFFFGVFNRVPDRGYAAAKAFGLLFVAYVTFLLAHNQAQGFTWESVALASGFLAFLSLVRLVRVFEYLVEFVRYRWRVCLAYELVFFLGFAAMVLLRAQVPQITYEISDFAAEKFTDFAVLNSLLSSRVFPPHDAWLSGFTLNYYYFGHFLWATVARFTGTSPAIAFNLGLASIFAYVLLLGVSLGYNVTAKLRWGFFCAFLIGLCSNLDGALQLFGIAREIWEGNLPLLKWYLGYDFWRSSRAIENTINEFPAFSFILGDLHAHLSSLVIFLAGLLLCVQAWRSVRRAGTLLRYELENPDELLFLALITGALYASNSWDSVTFAACMTATMWSGATWRFSRNSGQAASPASLVTWRLAVLLEAVMLTAIVGSIGIVLLFRPYWLDFLPPNTELTRVPSELMSSSIEFFVHWSLLLAPSLALLWVLLRQTFLRTGFGASASGLTREKFLGLGTVFAAAFLLGLVCGLGIVGSVCLVSFIALIYALVTGSYAPVLRLWLSFLAVFCLLASFCELYYFDDIFTAAIERINTVFKIYYGLWPIAAVSATLAASRLIRYGTKRERSMAKALVAFLLLLGAVYPVSGTLQRVAMSKHYPKTTDAKRSLDGLRYLATLQPDDYAVILWLRAFAEPDARIVEAPGKQYEYAGRIGTNTGRPSLGGWLYHEWGWRGNVFESERDRRFQLAEITYSDTSLYATVKALLENKFSYVIVGQIERERFPLLNEQKFEKLGALVYQHGGTKVYRLSPAILKAVAESQEDGQTGKDFTSKSDLMAPGLQAEDAVSSSSEETVRESIFNGKVQSVTHPENALTTSAEEPVALPRKQVQVEEPLTTGVLGSIEDHKEERYETSPTTQALHVAPHDASELMQEAETSGVMALKAAQTETVTTASFDESTTKAF